MKTVVVTITDLADGDLVIVNAEPPAGGKTSVKHRILGTRTRPILDEDGFAKATEQVPAQTQSDVAAALAEQVNREWLPECASAKVKPETGALVINCADLFDAVRMTVEVAGDGGTQISVDEF